MFRDLLSLVKHATVYGVGTILAKIIGFLMIPLYTRTLSTADYGVLELVVMSVDVIAMVVGVGMGAALLRFYDLRRETGDQRQVVSTALWITLISFGLATVVLYPFAGDAARLVLGSAEFRYLFELTFLNLFLGGVVELPLYHLMAMRQSGRYTMVRLLRLVAQLALNIWFLVGLNLGVEGILLSTLFTSAAFCLYLVVSTLRSVGYGFDLRLGRELFAYGSPLIFQQVGAFILTFADRFFIGRYASMDEVGVYALAYKFGMLLAVFILGPFQQIWNAQMFEIARRRDGERTIARVLTYLTYLMVGFALAMSLFIRETLVVVASADYLRAYRLVPLLASSYIFQGWAYVAMAGILIKRRTAAVAAATMVAAGVNLACNFAFIPRLAGWGAAIATIVSFATRMGVIYWAAQRIYPIPYRWSRPLLTVGWGALLYGVARGTMAWPWGISLATRALLLAAFPAGLYIARVLEPEERALVRLAVTRPREFVRQIRGGGVPGTAADEAPGGG